MCLRLEVFTFKGRIQYYIVFQKKHCKRHVSPLLKIGITSWKDVRLGLF